MLRNLGTKQKSKNGSLLAHYYTVAVRSLERYKTQSIISIIGLAVGFVCLALSSVWIRYENTYNTSIPDYKNLYAIGAVLSGNFWRSAPGGLITAMDEWPEVEAKGKYAIYSAYIGDEMTPQKSLIAHTSLFDILPIDVSASSPLAGDDLVLCAHNYRTRHFYPIRWVEMGADVYFTTANGTVYHYVVSNREMLKPTEVEKMLVPGDWDLTLFTCNTGGTTRCAIRCTRVN